ncbi:MAG: hypothetical protein R3E95_14125 [Thiolinea sp.]
MNEPQQLTALRQLSARVGADPLLVQAAGGNTSLKDGEVLWVKASGTWLMHAEERDIMVPVQRHELLQAVAAEDPRAETPQVFSLADLNSPDCALRLKPWCMH